MDRITKGQARAFSHERGGICRNLEVFKTVDSTAKSEGLDVDVKFQSHSPGSTFKALSSSDGVYVVEDLNVEGLKTVSPALRESYPRSQRYSDKWV